jgi:hypothetical protein
METVRKAVKTSIRTDVFLPTFGASTSTPTLYFPVYVTLLKDEKIHILQIFPVFGI